MKSRYKQRGSLLITALFIVIVVAALGVSLSRILSTSAHSNAIEYYGTTAFLAAQSGIEWKLSQLFTPLAQAQAKEQAKDCSKESPCVHPLKVYAITETSWPHDDDYESTLTVQYAGIIEVKDENNFLCDSTNKEYNCDKEQHKQHVYSSNISYSDFGISEDNAIKPDDFIDIRYRHQLIPKDGNKYEDLINIFFIATAGMRNYGNLFVSEFELDTPAEYKFFKGGLVQDVPYILYSKLEELCRTEEDNPNFPQNMSNMPHCSVEVSCGLINAGTSIAGNNSTNSTVNIYRISSTATCDAGRFSTEKTIYADVKAF